MGKTTLVLFVVLSALFQIAIIIITSTCIHKIDNKAWTVSNILLLVIGIVSLLFSIYGIYSINLENISRMKTYCIMLIAVIVCKVILGIYIFSAMNSISEAFGRQTWDERDPKFWDSTQKLFNCCGLHGPSDWQKPADLPLTCCPTQQALSKCDIDIAYGKGCKHYVDSMIHWFIAGYVVFALIVGGVEFICLILTKTTKFVAAQ